MVACLQCVIDSSHATVRSAVQDGEFSDAGPTSMVRICDLETAEIIGDLQSIAMIAACQSVPGLRDHAVVFATGIVEDP